MRILVVGATGGTGRELVRQGLERGYRVRAFVRDPKRLRIAGDRLEIVRGDVLDADSLTAAVEGCDAVLSALGHKRWLFPTRILSDGTRHVVEAMRRHGVRRFVCETALGIGDAWWRLGLWYTLFVRPVILPFYFHDKVRQERIVRASGLDWVLVRPGVLTNGRRGGGVRAGERVGHWLWSVRVARADVAAFMLDQLVDDTFLRRAPGIARGRGSIRKGSNRAVD